MTFDFYLTVYSSLEVNLNEFNLQDVSFRVHLIARFPFRIISILLYLE